MAIKLSKRSPITNADSLITIEGVPGYFSKFSGVKIKTTRPKYSDGLTTIKRPAGSGSTEYENVTLERSFDPDEDSDLITWCENARCADKGVSITARPVRRCNGVQQRGTKAWHLTGCLLENFEAFESDTSDGESVSMLALEFSVEQASWD